MKEVPQAPINEFILINAQDWLLFQNIVRWLFYIYCLSFCGQIFDCAGNLWSYFMFITFIFLVQNDPVVERYRRNQLNDLENITPFFILGLVYVSTNPSPAEAEVLFRVRWQTKDYISELEI